MLRSDVINISLTFVRQERDTERRRRRRLIARILVTSREDRER